MVAGNRNAVFTYILDIKQFLSGSRKVISANQQMGSSTAKTSGDVDRLGGSMQRTGQSASAAAINFQTATQGMLNLSTAGIQTFTSFSNLDRAGNRLAQAHIGVARAQDLLNNKQLRLNDLQAKGLGNTQKAALLTNELATARADLAVKTDKAKIEEGALFDIQLLFVANIANVMIASLQTIRTLKELHVAATIKQIVQEKLLATTIFTKVVPAQIAQIGAMRAYTVEAKTVVNTNRLLAIGIPVIGAAIVGVSLAYEAWTENLYGFRDAVTSVLPFLEDKKALLRDVQGELDGTNDSWQDLSNGMEKSTKKQIGLVEEWAVRTKIAHLEVQGIVNNSISQLERVNTLGTGIGSGFQAGSNQTALNGTKIPANSAHFLIGALAVNQLYGQSLANNRLQPAHTMAEITKIKSGITGKDITDGSSSASLKSVAQIKMIQDKAQQFSNLNRPGLQTKIDPFSGRTYTFDEHGVVIGSRFSDNPNFQSRLVVDPQFDSNFQSRLEQLYPTAFDTTGATITRDPALLNAQIAQTERNIEEFGSDKSPFGEARLRTLQLLLSKQKAVLSIVGRTRAVTNMLADSKGLGSVNQFNIHNSVFARDSPSLTAGGSSAFLNGGQFFTRRKVNFDGNGGAALAWYQLNTSASFGSKSHVLASLALAQVAATVPEGRRVNLDVSNFLGDKVNSSSPNFAGFPSFANGTFASGGASGVRGIGRPKIDPSFRIKRSIADDNRSRLKTGGTRIVDEFGIPLFQIYDENAVEGGFTSLSTYRAYQKKQFGLQTNAAVGFLGLIGGSIGERSGAEGPINRARGKAIAQMNESLSLLQRTGLSLTDRYRGTNGRGYKTWIRFNEYTSFRGAAQARAEIIARNQITLKKAGQIDLLEGGFGLSGFFGSGAPLQSLQDEVARQDNIISTIGLNRTEAFQIIDTQGRGRAEIDDRYRWSQRLSIISTGNSVV